MSKKVTVIKASKTLDSKSLSFTTQKERVCAYARVSTDLEEQESSFKTQIEYYTEYIKSNPDWDFVGIYADEGKTGTNTKHRPEFNRMIDDAKNGKIDIILSKSISRISRNTLLTIQTVRELKEIGVYFIFEKEKIDTRDPKSELQLTIFSSLAQEESRSISENVKWGIEKRAMAGKVSVPYKNFLGYCKGPNDTLEIVPEQAETVQRIYNEYLSGNTISNIAKTLTKEHIPTPARKTKWSPSTVRSILENEKYIGDAILFKTYTPDYISKTVKKNNGERNQYYVQDSHPAIISKEDYALVQAKLEQSKRNRFSSQSELPFSGILQCEDCGEYFGHKTWKSRSTHVYDMWVCNHKSSTTTKDSSRCKTPNLRQEKVIEVYLSAMEDLLPLQAELEANYADKLTKYQSKYRITRYKNKLAEAESDAKRVASEIDILNHTPSNYDSYETYEQYKSELYEQLAMQKTEVNKIKEKEENLKAEIASLKKFVSAMKIYKKSHTFSPAVFVDTVKVIKVGKDYLNIVFKNGTTIKKYL